MIPPPVFVPVLPESAPFSPEQRAYLNGYLAGLFSYAPQAGASPPTARIPALSLRPLTILFGSQTGTCEKLARRIAKEAGPKGFAATIHDLAGYSIKALPTEENLIVITSTFGDGEPPDNAQGFAQALQTVVPAALSRVRFSVCGLGDTNYTKFCGFARELDAQLERLGGVRVAARAECDVEYEAAFAAWLTPALEAFSSGGPAKSAALESPSPGQPAPSETPPATPAPTGHGRQNPFAARLLTNRPLNGQGSEKDVRHFEFDLTNSGLSYEAGDALGVFPQNDPTLVEELLSLLKASGDEVVRPGGSDLRLRDALTQACEITRIPRPLLEWYAQNTGDAELLRVSAPDANGELTRFLYGREIIDLVLAFPKATPSPQEFVSRLKKLQPRLYSISSSPKAHPQQVHLTVGTVRYVSLGRPRKGVCSTYLAERVTQESSVPIFVHRNTAFRPPPPDLPMIMVGPGTGIAPFRAFLEERRASGSKGLNWLFFGDQRSSSDFLYQDELTAFQQDGLLNRLDLAWSRDQGSKVYVQDRMRANAAELWRWLDLGAAFYVCGDASRMAKDVEAALMEIIQSAGGRTPEAAQDYLKSMKSGRRYQRDVY